MGREQPVQSRRAWPSVRQESIDPSTRYSLFATHHPLLQQLQRLRVFLLLRVVDQSCLFLNQRTDDIH